MPAKPARAPRPTASAPAASAAGATLLLIRHGPVEDQGRLVGRRDLTIRIDRAAVARLGRRIGPVDRIAVSPAMRCRQTAAALWPDCDAAQLAALWEQDFGAWEGASYAHLPDLGPLSADDLAATAPPGGESFADACARIVPALEALAAGGGRVAVVAHAGTVRAALARALGSPGAALAFRIAPLSLTRIEASPAGWAVGFVNLTADESTDESTNEAG
ncbi:histidine phosphatase family protein [Paracoccus sanguinis]|uniref:histidine phosphatase family protein n=1 Tax=Paracoccus sanguinis TaxID=1545044 RepID=UPI0009E072EE|nr:histidine phosphatase family protein [Paracoccus sanguinis]